MIKFYAMSGVRDIVETYAMNARKEPAGIQWSTFETILKALFKLQDSRQLETPQAKLTKWLSTPMSTDPIQMAASIVEFDRLL